MNAWNLQENVVISELSNQPGLKMINFPNFVHQFYSEYSKNGSKSLENWCRLWIVAFLWPNKTESSQVGLKMQQFSTIFNEFSSISLKMSRNIHQDNVTNSN